MRFQPMKYDFNVQVLALDDFRKSANLKFQIYNRRVLRHLALKQLEINHLGSCWEENRFDHLISFNTPTIVLESNHAMTVTSS